MFRLAILRLRQFAFHYLLVQNLLGLLQQRDGPQTVVLTAPLGITFCRNHNIVFGADAVEELAVSWMVEAGDTIPAQKVK